MSHNIPKWERGDSLKSIKDILTIGTLSLKECILDAAAWVDTRAASAINNKEDEL